MAAIPENKNYDHFTPISGQASALMPETHLVPEEHATFFFLRNAPAGQNARSIRRGHA
jgi:hypothetical protein